MAILDRVMVRLSGESPMDIPLVEEFITLISDRLKLRLGVDTLPTVFESIAVDGVIKMYRRQYYEGISSESMDTISTKFVDDILKEYNRDIQSYIDSEKLSNLRNVVRFL